MKLIVQPDAGIPPIVTAIKRARKSIDVVIFRLDVKEIVNALTSAVTRGVAVRALIAHTNRGGEKSLRKLEMGLLEAGVTVSRTADDLVRYHGKMMIVDGASLHVYGFNFTRLDIDKSRSFGVVTKNRQLVQAAITLFETDVARQAYTPSVPRFVVSPDNARQSLTTFIKGARKQLWIYDPQVSDPAMLRLLEERVKKGVDVRIIGKVAGKSSLSAQPFPGRRLHMRAILRDARRAFLGSQSLRKLELDRRREVGVIVEDPSVMKALHGIFEQDWALTEAGKAAARERDARDDEKPKGEAERAAQAAG